MTVILYVIAVVAFGYAVVKSQGKDPIAWGLVLFILAHFLEGALS